MQRQRQRTVLGGQSVGAARVDDGHRAEKIVDRLSNDGQPLLGQPVAGIGW